MIKDGVIVDTSVFINFLKGKEKYAMEVTALLEMNRVVTTGIIIAELMQGIRKQEEEEHIADIMTSINILEIPTELWIKAGKLSSSLRRKGITLPLTDIAIAAIAIDYNLSLFTLDKHFEKIPGVKVYKI